MVFVFLCVLLLISAVVDSVFFPLNAQILLFAFFFDRSVYKKPPLGWVELVILSVFTDILMGQHCGLSLLGILLFDIILSVIKFKNLSSTNLVRTTFLITLFTIKMVLCLIQSIFYREELVFFNIITDVLIGVIIFPVISMLFSFIDNNLIFYAKKTK